MKKQQILNTQIVGNAHSDMPLMRAIDQFTQDPANSITDKADVQEFLEVQVMGCPSTRTQCADDAEYVQLYLDGI